MRLVAVKETNKLELPPALNDEADDLSPVMPRLVGDVYPISAASKNGSAK